MKDKADIPSFSEPSLLMEGNQSVQATSVPHNSVGTLAMSSVSLWGLGPVIMKSPEFVGVGSTKSPSESLGMKVRGTTSAFPQFPDLCIILIGVIAPYKRL